MSVFSRLQAQHDAMEDPAYWISDPKEDDMENQTCTTCEYSWTASTTGNRYCGKKQEEGGGTSVCTPEEKREGCIKWEQER